ERAMTRSEVILGNGGLLTLRETAANRWLEDAVGRLVARAPLAETSHVFSIDERIFRVSVTLAPGRDPNGTTQQLLLPRPLVLVVINLLVGGTLQVDHAGLRFAFGLSAAEIRLCELLVNGHSLNEAATQLGLSD